MMRCTSSFVSGRKDASDAVAEADEIGIEVDEIAYGLIGNQATINRLYAFDCVAQALQSQFVIYSLHI